MALAAASTLMPPNVRRVLAKEPTRRGSLRDIKHVVLLMQENRSFDHYFGTLAGVRGFDDPKPLQLSSGQSVFYQPDSENPKDTCCPSISIRIKAALKEFHRPAMPGQFNMPPGMGAAWTDGCPRTARRMESTDHT